MNAAQDIVGALLEDDVDVGALVGDYLKSQAPIYLRAHGNPNNTNCDLYPDGRIILRDGHCKVCKQTLRDWNILRVDRGCAARPDQLDAWRDKIIGRYLTVWATDIRVSGKWVQLHGKAHDNPVYK